MTSLLTHMDKELVTKENIATPTIILNIILPPSYYCNISLIKVFIRSKPSFVEILSQQTQLSVVLNGSICNGPPTF